MTSRTRTLTRCLVCGFAEVQTDEVVDAGVVFLAECPRCDHRWTHFVEEITPRRRRIALRPGLLVSRGAGEVASAA